MRKRSVHQHTRPMTAVTGISDDTPLTRHAAQRALPPVVYAVRLPNGLIKIGHTANLGERRRALRATAPDALLAIMPGSRDDEQAVHDELADHVHHGREWYYPTPGVLRVVNEMRERLGMEPLEAA